MTDRLGEGDSALITGGAGFIGSNLAHFLLARGVEITILDTMSDEYGANRRNLFPAFDEVELCVGDVRDETTVSKLVEGVDAVFHLAAQLSRPISMDKPKRDIEINCKGTVTILEAVRKHNPDAKVVYTGSQAAYGEPTELPLTESVAPNPVDVYGANKLAAEQYCNVYHRAHGIDTTTVRLTNVYGPRAQLSNPNYGVINKFIKLSIKDKNLTVYEPGTMKRDPVFVNDVVRALVSAAESPEANGEMFVIASGESVTIHKLAQTIVDTVGTGTVEMVPWPEDWDSIRVGDIHADPAYAQNVLGWESTTGLKAGLRETVEYYQVNQDAYLE